MEVLPTVLITSAVLVNKIYMKVNSYPWPHSIIDEYYPDTLFKDMQIELTRFAEQTLEQIRSGDLNKNVGYRFNRHKVGERSGWLCSNTSKFKLFPKTSKCLSSRSIDIADLEYFPNHRKFNPADVDVRTVIAMVFTDNHESGVIHYDWLDKIFTSAVYVSPESSRGTILYNENKEYVSEVEWAPNRALLFAPTTDITWHSYESRPNSFRVAITEFIKDIKVDTPF